MNGFRTLRLALLVTLLLPLAATNVLAKDTVRSWWRYAFPPQNSAAFDPVAAGARDLVALLPALDGKTVPERADAVRLFLNNHSQHLIDDEFYGYWQDIPRMMAMIENNAEGKAQKRPHMECATRSATMHHMLAALGIDSRIVILHHKDRPGITHTFLEIFDPATGLWTLQDPDVNIFWIRNEDQSRARIEDMLRRPVLANFTPCQAPGACGYNDESKAYVPYFALATRFHPYTSNTVRLSVNPQRFQKLRLMRRFVNTPVYCALYEKSCAFIVDEIRN